MAQAEVPQIVLGDAQTVFLDALRAILDQAGKRVVATTSTRADVLEAVRAWQPTICVSDDSFPDGPILDVIDDLGRSSPHTKVVLLTADGDPYQLRRALDAGVVGYVHKMRGIGVLLDALRRVGAGELVVEGSFARRTVAVPAGEMRLRRLAAYLTHRESECLALLVDGYGTAGIARRLGVSSTTVRSHIQAILTKLGAHSRLEAASLAVRYGLVGAVRTDAGFGTDIRLTGSAR